MAVDSTVTAAPLIWFFARCRFDETRLELWVGETLVELERKPIEVLRHLLRHAGEVVTRDELQQAVWPGRVLSDTVMAKAISRLREVMQDADQGIIKTVHGYGYRLVAEVTVSAASTATPPSVLGLQVGDHPPLRPNWQLVEHLNSGGFGEVWRVAQAKSLETRVCKFALHADALVVLKREITLLRVLRAQLGSAAPVAELLDWNLEEAPYFLELPDYPHGNLADWFAAQQAAGEAIPQSRRLEIFAAIAEAAARVHDVGVLHKDIKPSNILMSSSAESIRPLLSDFGGGGVLADALIANAGVTRLGFTQAIEPGRLATPLYAAPELMVGQPHTVRSDVYALGVLLYQLLIGDFRTPLASGWEAQIDHELLREDIAAAVQGSPERRLASAQALADRIRSLQARTTERALQRTREEAERTLARIRTRRGWMLAIMSALAIGLGIAWFQYLEADRERHRAEAAAATALETGRFMFQGMLSAFDVTQQGRSPVTTVEQLLDNAAHAADERLGQQPEIDFHVRTALINAYVQIDGGFGKAQVQLAAARAALKRLIASDPRRAVQVVPPEGIYLSGPEDKVLLRELLDIARREFGPHDRLLLGFFASLSDAEFRYGSLQSAQRFAYEGQQLAERLGDATSAEDSIAFRIRLAREDANFPLAESLLPAAERSVKAHHPVPPVSLAYLQMDRGITRVTHGEPLRAAEDVEQGIEKIGKLQSTGTWYYRFPLAYLAMLRADQQRFDEARRLIAEWQDIQTKASPTIDMPMESLVVAETAWRIGDRKPARALLQQLESTTEPGRPRCLANHARLQLATMAAEDGDLAGAHIWLGKLQPADWYDYRTGHPSRAVEAEARGLLARAEGRPEEALERFTEAQALYAATYAAPHWRRQRIQRLLQAGNPE